MGGKHLAGSVLFVVATFVVTWSVWTLSARLGKAIPLAGLGGPVFMLGVFAPALVALVLTWSRAGREGVANLLRPITVWSLSPWWYLTAFFYLPVIKLSAAAIHRAWTGTWLPFGEMNILLIVLAMAVSTWVQAGEEIGWRGYLLPRLESMLGLRFASVLVGVIWALWHLPLFVIPGTDSTGQSFPLYLMYVTAISVAMAWAYSKTGSLFLIMFMHASLNNTTGIIRVTAPGATNPWTWNASVGAWAMVALAWVISAALLLSMSGRSVSRTAAARA